MNDDNRQVAFKLREFKGSRFRCLLVTSMPKRKFLGWINSLVQPFAEVGESDVFMPEGFAKPAEARLGETQKFLNGGQRKSVTQWWLAVAGRANTPNWDLVSTCTIGGRSGLILVEAKAHETELNATDDCGAKHEGNRKQIYQAIEEARSGLGDEWSIAANKCYQLSNRFAWTLQAWASRSS